MLNLIFKSNTGLIAYVAVELWSNILLFKRHANKAKGSKHKAEVTLLPYLYVKPLIPIKTAIVSLSLSGSMRFC